MSETIEEKPKPGIGLIHYLTGWIIDLLDAVSFLLLVGVGVITVASAFQGGNLIQNSPFLTQAYSWSLGIGIEGQLSVMCVKAVKAGINGHGGQAILYWFVAFFLFTVSVATAGIVVYQEAYHVTFDEALLAVGVPLFFWDWGRAVMLYSLIVLGSATRYVKPKPRLSLEEELAEIERKTALTAANQRLNAQKFRGFAGALKAGVDGVRGREEAPVHPVEQVALAQENQGDIPEQTTVLTTSEPPALKLKQRGKWWDAPSYQGYLVWAYNRAITPDKALEQVQSIGGGMRASELKGHPYIAGVIKLKNEAKRLYGEAQGPANVPGYAEQMAE